MTRYRGVRLAAFSMTCLCLFLSRARAQETPPPPPPPDRPWSDSAELGFVLTSGNSETSSLGMKNSLKRKGIKSGMEIKAAAVRVESTTKTRTVIAPGVVDESKTTETTAENYNLDGRYDYKITPKFFWFTGAGWDRNRFAGIQNRYEGRGGIGNIWEDTDRVKFRTDYALTFTKQENVVEEPGFDDTFVGARVSSAFQHKVGANSTYGNDFIVDENLNDTSDLRGDMTNWFAVAINPGLALKVSLQWLYDHTPASAEAKDPNGVLAPVLVELDSLDTIFTSSLVVKW